MTWYQFQVDASGIQNQEFLNSSYYADLTVYLPKGFTLNSTFNYSLFTGGGISGSQGFPLLSAYLGKTFLKADRGELRLTAFDLLNQNTGISRTTDVNYLQESRYNTLSRYFMLSFTYKFIALSKGKK